MACLGLLDMLFPELAAMRGIPYQPGQPLDLFAHSIRTYQAVEALINDPSSYLPDIAEAVSQFFQAEERQALVKWAALLHAIGTAVECHKGSQEPATASDYTVSSATLWEQTGSRLKLSRKQIDFIKTLIAQNGQALELPILEAQERLSLRFMHGWCSAGGQHVGGICSGARPHPGRRARGHGRAKHRRTGSTCRPHLGCLSSSHPSGDHSPAPGHRPRLTAALPPAPGPHFKPLLNDLEVAQIEGHIRTRAEALHWVEAQLP